MAKTPTWDDDYTENSLVEQPAIEIFRELGWQTANGFDETLTDCHITGREGSTEVVLKRRLINALKSINPDIPDDALDQAINELTPDRSTKTLVAANKEVYALLKEGVLVKFRGPHSKEKQERVRLIDWEHPENNDFFLVQQFWVNGSLYRRRPDLVGFVNGIPLILVELKRPTENIQRAYDDNLRDYRDTIPHIFWYSAFIIISNGVDSGFGTLTSPFEHFNEWKKVEDERAPTEASLATMIRGMCEPSRLLDIIENFTLFSEEKGGTQKYVTRYHQYHGVNNAIEAVRSIDRNHGRLGVFWHTQGSGKSYSMVFFSQKVLRKIRGNWSFVIVTDRLELDDQIYKTFARAGVVYEPEESVRAQSSEHLRQLLKEDHRYLFTIIHKFRTERGEKHPRVSDRSDIIVITDEAHRTQYDILAENMRTALPNAAFLGFTGTPLIVGEEKTVKEFGKYVSIYNFAQSVQDHSTVPLYYENRVPELQLINESYNDDMLSILEEAELDSAQEEKLERLLSKQYHLITRDDRLEKIAEDIVEHFTSRGHQGKAMVISIDRMTAVRMYDKVQKYWKEKIERLQGEIKSLRASNPDAVEREHVEELRALVAYMKGSDMAVVISQSQNEVDDFRKKGLDITPHRRRLVTDTQLDEKFKDADNPLRIVFVCAMWITGFDARPCSTIYLDKPMRNHSLMQAIARANRVFRDKKNGLIVDYIGMFNNLRKALSIYGSISEGGVAEGDMPVKMKDALVEELRKAMADAERFCRERGIYLTAIQAAEGLDRGMLIKDAADTILENDKSKRDFLSLVSSVNLLYRAIKPDPREEEFNSTRRLLVVIARRIEAAAKVVDVLGVMKDIDELLDRSVAAEPYVMPEDPVEHLTTDLSKIDFEKLRREFAKGRKRTYVERLRSITQYRIRELVRFNKSRVDYMKRLQVMIDDYNAGRMDVDQFFEALVRLMTEMDEEEKRHAEESLTEEELAVFDLLTRPPDRLSKKDKEKVKMVARSLLRVLKEEKLGLDWRKTQQTRAAVHVAIMDELEKLPDVYSEELYKQKCELVYQHVYESYWGRNQSVYVHS